MPHQPIAELGLESATEFLAQIDFELLSVRSPAVGCVPLSSEAPTLTRPATLGVAIHRAAERDPAMLYPPAGLPATFGALRREHRPVRATVSGELCILPNS